MVHLTPKEILARAKEFLQCADYAAQNNYINGCAISSYAALFWVARAALAYEGMDRPNWRHSELRSKFTDELIQKRSRYPQRFGTWLSDAYSLRTSAQYLLVPPQAKKTKRMVNHVKEFIRKTEEVIEK
jgi:uncharacterized protein (UPF0332 family)